MTSKKKNSSKVANPALEDNGEQEIKDDKHLLQSVIDASLTGIGFLKPIHNGSKEIIDFLCVFANKKALEYAGGIEVSGKQYCELFPGIAETPVFKHYIKAFEDNDVQDFEIHYTLGQFNNWFRVIAVKVGDGIVVSWEDISPQKKAERELLAQHNILKQTEELAQAGSWEYNIEKKEFSWSDGMYRLFKMKKNTPVIPAVYLKYAVEEDLPIAQKIVDAIEKTFQPLEETLRIQLNGAVKTLKIRTAPLKNENGEVEKTLGVDMDITSTQRSEEKIMELNQSLASMNKELSSLNAELKNFNSIAANNYSEVLRQVYIQLETIVTTDARTLSDSSRANLRRAQSGIQRMKLLTNDISNYLQLYDIGVNKKMIDPNSIIADVLKGMKAKIEDAQATINATEIPAFPADPLLFTHLVTNLLDNAIKFRKPEVDPVITIRYSNGESSSIPKGATNGTYMIINVTDNGIGFQQEDLDKMFELFSQLPNQGKHKGSGMGLAICRKIMQLHGGFMTAESEEGNGAAFSCHFPT